MSDLDHTIVDVQAILSTDGRIAQWQFIRESGRVTFVNLLAVNAPILLRQIEQALNALPREEAANGNDDAATP